MKLLFTSLSILMALTLSAQTKIKGVVLDESGAPMPGVNVLIKDSYDGTSSDLKGTYIFSTTEQGVKTLVATFVGYKAFEQTIELKGKDLEINISLKEQINQLDAVVISAGSFTAGEEKRRTILRPIDIATTAGATADIAGALNTLPGTQKVGESGRLFVRGGDFNETRTFIDGVAVLDAYGPAAPNTPSRGRFLPFMFKGTSFSTGGYSAEYGQALSSALVLNSKDKADINQTDVGIMSVGADVAHTQVSERASWSGKVQYTDIRPYFGAISQRVDWKTPPVSLEGSTAYRRQLGKGILKFFGNFNSSSFTLFNHDILDPSIKQEYNLVNNYRYGNASYQSSIGDNWNLRSGVSYTFNENKLKVDGSPLQEQESGVHAKTALEHSVSDNVEVRFGGEIIDRRYTASRWNEPLGQTQGQSFNETIASSFAETEIYINKHVVTKSGLRFEYNSLNATSGVDPRLSLAYKPGRRGQFSVAYGRFRQSAKNQYVRVSNDLGSERAEHFIVNYQVVTDRRTFRVETYYKKYFDLVTFARNNPLDISNAGYGYAKGVEFFWRDNQTIRNVDYWISYSFLDSKRNYLDYPQSAAPSFASKHNFSVVYKHFIKEIKSQVGATYSFASGRPYFNPNLGDDSFQSQRTPAYHDLSVNISYLPKNWLILYASCTNLTGRNNIFGYQYSTSPDSNGEYVSRPVRQPAPRFMFLGVFITFSKNKSVNQLPNL